MPYNRGDMNTTSTAAAAAADDALPPVPAWLQNGFQMFVRGYLRRHFDAVAVCRENRLDADALADGPLLIYTNHPSWWDPIVAHFLNDQLLGNRQFRAPIDADALEQYGVFKKLGFFGVQSDTRHGATTFLRTASSVLNSPDDVLWITPEGRFADVRDSSATLMPGMAHVAAKAAQNTKAARNTRASRNANTGRGHAVAMALEYVFWNERLPMCLVRFSPPIGLQESVDKSELLALMTDTLRQTQSALAEVAISRERTGLDDLLVGKSGGGWLYDSFRRVKAWCTGRTFSARHESTAERVSP